MVVVRWWKWGGRWLLLEPVARSGKKRDVVGWWKWGKRWLLPRGVGKSKKKHGRGWVAGV